MRKNYTILSPQMSPIHFRLLEEAFNSEGYNFEILENDNRSAIDMGLKYVNNDACYPSLIVVGLAGSRLVDAARDAGMRVAQEYFVDRNYTDDGELVNRREPDALITDEAVAIERAIKAITEGEVISRTGKVIEITADTICIHGDGEKALRFARDIREAFGQAGIDIRPL